MDVTSRSLMPDPSFGARTSGARATGPGDSMSPEAASQMGNPHAEPTRKPPRPFDTGLETELAYQGLRNRTHAPWRSTER